MQINKNRKGLALGAVLTLLASAFVGMAPAAATNPGTTGQLALQPVSGPTANFNGTIYEAFPIQAFLNDGFSSDGFNSTAGTAELTSRTYFEVTKVSGNLDVLINTTQTASGAIGTATTPASASSAVASISGVVLATATNTMSTTVKAHKAASDLAVLNLQAFSTSSLTSGSPSVTLDIKVFIDSLGGQDGEWVTGEWYTTVRVVLHNANSIPAVTTLTAVNPSDTVVTVSSTVSTLNWANLANGQYFLQVASTNNHIESASTGTTPTVSDAVLKADMTLRAGVVSSSFVVSGSSGVTAGTSVSAQLFYSTQSAVANQGFAIGNLATSVAAGTLAANLTLTAITSSDAVQSGSALVRANKVVTYRVTATSNSASISGVAIVVSFSQTAGTGLSLNVKEISVNGAAFTTSYPSALALTTGTDGTATFTVATSGFVGDETLNFAARERGAVTVNLNAFVRGTVATLTADYSTVAMAPGATSAIGFAVKDQWNQAVAATNLRLAVTKGGVAGFSYTDTLSYTAVAAGKATFNFTPTPATKTGSAKVTAQLQEQQASTGAFTNVGSAVEVTVNVSATADAFGTGLKASYSSSVSYFPSTLAAAVAVSGKVTNTGSAVVITGTGLVFEDANGDTFSNAVTVRADGTLTYTANVYGTVAGTYTLTITNGSASTTSQFIVGAATHDSGRSITFDTTAIEAGKTRIITGKVLDANGNPVATGNTASILVTFAGTAGIPVGAMPTQTNADGEFQVSILTSAADRGTFTLTATYLKSGATTATKDRITVAQPITIGAAAAGSSSDQKLTVGSFKGFVAIYALNYTGQKLSAKVAGRWLVVNSLIRFERVVRNTGAAIPIVVDLYIDGKFVRTENIVTK